MIKSILKVGLMLVVGILGYNYFLGSPEEKAQSKEIIGKAVDVGKAGVGLLKVEVSKFKSGKYDNALDKIGNVIDKAKSKVKEGGEILKEVKAWEEKKSKWLKKKEELEDILGSDALENASDETKERIKEINEEGESLEKEGEKLKDELAKETD